MTDIKEGYSGHKDSSVRSASQRAAERKEAYQTQEAEKTKKWNAKHEARQKELQEAKGLDASVIIIVKNGEAGFCAHYDDFVDLMESPAGFGDTVREAVLALFVEEDEIAEEGGPEPENPFSTETNLTPSPSDFSESPSQSTKSESLTSGTEPDASQPLSVEPESENPFEQSVPASPPTEEEDTTESSSEEESIGIGLDNEDEDWKHAEGYRQG